MSNPFKMWGSWVGGVLAIILFLTIITTESNICPPEKRDNQFTSKGTSICQNALDLGLITGDGQEFASNLVCYNNIVFETDSHCITPIVYFPVYTIVTKVTASGASELMGLGVLIAGIVLYIYGFLIGWGIHSLIRK